MNRSKTAVISGVLLSWTLVAGLPRHAACDDMSSMQQQLLQDYMQMYKGVDSVAVGLWYADPIWDLLAGSEAGKTAEMDAQNVLLVQKVLRPYTLMAVLYAEKGSDGKVAPISEKWLRKKVRLIDNDGKEYKPLEPKKIPAEVQELMKKARYGVLSQQGNEWAENMYFLLFTNVTKKGQLILDYRRPGSFALRVADASLIWRTPIQGPPKRSPL